MKTTETEAAINGAQLALTRYIPWLLQTLLLLTVLPYLPVDGIVQAALTKDGAVGVLAAGGMGVLATAEGKLVVGGREG